MEFFDIYSISQFSPFEQPRPKKKLSADNLIKQKPRHIVNNKLLLLIGICPHMTVILHRYYLPLIAQLGQECQSVGQRIYFVLFAVNDKALCIAAACAFFPVIEQPVSAYRNYGFYPVLVIFFITCKEVAVLIIIDYLRTRRMSRKYYSAAVNAVFVGVCLYPFHR